jgi:hypothetical protein
LPEVQPLDASLGAIGAASLASAPLGDVTPLPQSDLAGEVAARNERRAKNTSGDLLQAMVREDSPVWNMVGDVVAKTNFEPDPKFDALEPKGLAESMKGLPEEYLPVMAKAVSEQHRTYLRMQLDDKVADQRKLADMGMGGQAARFLAGLVEPTNLAIGLVAPGASLLKMKPLASAAAQLGAGGAMGYGFEKLRQAYTFEHSDADAAWAGAMGVAFAAPFVGLSMREASKLKKAAADTITRDIAIRGEPGAVDPAAAEAAHQSLEAGAKEHEQAVIGWAPEHENGPVKDVPPGEPPRLPGPDPLGEHVEPVSTKGDTTPPSDNPAVHETLVGKDVSWTDAEGEHRTGNVKRDEGGEHIVVEDDDTGKTIRVSRESLHANAPETEGFLAGSVGGAQIKHTHVELTAMSKARFDIFARLNRSKNPIIARLGSIFVKDAINPSEHYAQTRAVSEDKRLLQRTVAGNFHYETVSAYDAAASKLGLGFLAKRSESNVRRFNEDVGRFIRDPQAFTGHPARAEIERAANAARKVYASMLEEMQRAGVKGADELAANPSYLNRMWSQEKLRAAAEAHGGADVVAKLVATSIKDKDAIIKRFREKNPKSLATDEQVLQQSAGKFLNSVMRLEYSHLSNDLLLTASDAHTLRAELKKSGLSTGEVDSLIDTMFEVKEAAAGDAGQPAQLKYRFNLDESAKIETKAGTLSMADLFENDARVLVDRYMNSMAGHVAMARAGIRSRAEFEGLLRDARQHHESNRMLAKDGAAYAEEEQMLRDVYDHIVGRPMSVHSFNAGDRIANTLRAYGRSVYLGQLGFTAMMETFHAAGLMTWRAAFQQMPSLAQFVKAARAGQRADKGLAADVVQMLGVLNEHVSGYLRQHEVTEYTYDRKLTAVENVANRLSHMVDKASGNSFTTSLTRGMAAAGMIQKYANFAHGKTKLTDAWRKRIVGSGIHADDIDHVLSQLRAHADMDGNRVAGIRWEEWSAKDPASYRDFVTAVDRDVRQGVQDHDLGETWMFQHTALGKVFTELRAFSIAGHSKQFLNALHYRDGTSLQLFTTSMIVNGLAYVVQTSANFAHDPKELDKRLTTQRIVKAAWARSNMLGILPFLTDTMVPGFVSPMAQTSGQGLTANTDARNILMPPSFNLLAKGVNFVQNGRPQDGLSLLPFSNTYGARNLIDMIGKAHPQTQAPR